MSEEVMTQHGGDTSSARNPLVRSTLQLGVTGIICGVLLFLAAGRLDWPLGWLFVALWFVPKILYLVIVYRHDPALLAERSGGHADTKGYDRVILPVYFVLAFVTIFVAGLDAGRYGWSGQMPVGVVVSGVVVYLAFNLLALWAMLANTFHSNVSRIQMERGHEVVSSGPYRYVRHPTYLASLFLWLSTPLIVGSWWGLVPATLTGAMMLLRAAFEDRMLRRELPGYATYARRVRYRLLPGVW